MQMIGVAVTGLNDLGKLIPAVQDLGRRHVGYGVKAEHYDTVGAALLDTLAKGLGDDFTPETKEACDHHLFDIGQCDERRFVWIGIKNLTTSSNAVHV